MNVHPLPTAAADVFSWQTAVTIASNVVGSNTGYGTFQLDSDKSFMLLAYTGSTNYDSYAGDFIASVGNPLATARAGVTPPFVPNNFQVEITVNQDWRLTGDSFVPQACLCSNGSRNGTQFPIPVIFQPMTKFSFKFVNVARTLQLTAALAAKPMVINFGMVGMFINNQAMDDVLMTFPSYARLANGPIQSWLRKFTNTDPTAFA